MGLKAAPADQELLLELQALDTRSQQIAHRAARLPEAVAVATLTAELEAVRRTVVDRTGVLEDASAELGRVESDVAVVDARVARDRQRASSSSSVKDLQALEQELEALARRKSDLEDIELAVMETVEEREADLAAARGDLESLESRLAEATGARDAALGDLEAERARIATERGALSSRVPADLLALYERQRDRYGVGASHLQRGVTSASGVALTASDLDRIRAAAADDVLLCPDSSAVLVRTAESGL
jgi:predicted  nucleic acid-binding Zn-ribbon protein